MRTKMNIASAACQTEAVPPPPKEEDEEEETVIVTKVVLDFDDCLFPSSLYRRHNLLRYHESECDEPISAGRHKFHELEPDFARLKKDIDLVCFKLMQMYDKENFCILSTGDYQWITSTLKDYGYLLSAYNTRIISTQQWHKTHPQQQKHFNVSNSLQSKQFLMKHLLSQWREQLRRQYHGKHVQIRLISIGDSFFEFLACHDIGFDYVNRVKLLEEPSVSQMTQLWRQVLLLTASHIYDQNVVFMSEAEHYHLDVARLAALNRQCVDRLWHKENLVWQSLHEIITRDNEQHYQVREDKNGTRSHEKMVSDNVSPSIEQQIQLLYDSLQTHSTTPKPTPSRGARRHARSGHQQSHPHHPHHHHYSASYPPNKPKQQQTQPVRYPRSMPDCTHVHATQQQQLQHVNTATAHSFYHGVQSCTSATSAQQQQHIASHYQQHMLYAQQQLLYAQQWMMEQHSHMQQTQYFMNVPSCTPYMHDSTSELNLDMRHLNLTPSVTTTTLSNT
mmetsp:Transcript_24226/g.38967  ORF Transcript_24226/g.38967 Transcript_24226/m.38967 type:complete len:504 (+) Transcript_24226:120-1631(+)